jgi:hypothetical protein
MEKKYSFALSHFFTLLLMMFSAHGALASDGYERGGPFPSYTQESDIYLNKIQPILDRRCAVCHSCFEAPCQMKLSSSDMVVRGATAHLTNGGIKAAPRSDMMTTLQQQRAGGFFSVTEGASDSLFVNLLLAGNNKDGLPPEQYIEPKKRQCVSSTEIYRALDFKNQKSLGMPYYMASLSEAELQTLISWSSQGAKTPSEATLQRLAQPKVSQVIQDWEDFFNTATWKGKWTSRYLYEHLFTAHFYFEQSPGEFYQLVRSKTAAPHKIDIIATVRPFEMLYGYDNRFYYRLQKVQSTIVHKQHFVYHIYPQTMDELKNLFWKPNWNSTEAVAPFNFEKRNPFVAFEHIPANSRYRWMLKNARMLIDMDMRSENCHGNGAAGPLRENFLVLFVKPESDVAVRYPNYFKEANPYLEMANTGTSNFIMNFKFTSNQVKYSKVKHRHQMGLLPNGFSFDDIWDGEGGTQMPFFTIMRHEKNVSVHDGPWGPRQRVSQLFDYVSFERLYYNCVGLTTLFDNINDKIGTVLYLRDVGREVEEQLLSLIPDHLRAKVRAEWVQGEGAKHQFDVSKFSLKFNPELLKRPGFVMNENDPYGSMMDYLLLKSGRFSSKVISTNYYPMSNDTPQYAQLKAASLEMNREIVKGEFNRAHHFPNISYLMVKGAGSAVTYYTIVANRFYEYINYLPLKEPKGPNPGRLPSKDWMSVFPDITINYPGKIYIVDEAGFDQFLQRMKSVKSRADYVAFDKAFGLQKMSPQFWNVIDQIQTHFIQSNIIHNGSIDLNDYGMHDLVGSP